MAALDQHWLYLFFTRGVALTTWRDTGTMAREARVYRELLPRLAGVGFLSYGRGDKALEPELGGIKVRGNALGLRERLFAPLAAHVLPRFWPGPAIAKSNQVIGAEVMLAAAKARGWPSITRAGNLPSNIAAWAQGPESPRAREMRRLEKMVFRGADRAVLTTQWMAELVQREYGVEQAKIRVIPNYVDTEVFAPDGGPRRDDLVVYVGRLHEEKNLAALIEAVAALGVELEIIGQGHLRPALEDQARRLGARVEFLGGLPNQELPARINRAAAFVFPSTGEHHPKSLIEAMSCGAAVAACRVTGVEGLVEHGVTGWLTGTSATEIQEGLAHILGDAGLRDRMGAAARDHCLRNYALDKVCALELALYEELAS